MKIKDLRSIAKALAVEIVKLSATLRESGHYLIADRLEMRGTKIGAYISRVEISFSRRDALYELKRAYKAAYDTQKLLDTLYATKRISLCKYKKLTKKCAATRESIVTLCRLIKK